MSWLMRLPENLAARHVAELAGTPQNNFMPAGINRRKTVLLLCDRHGRQRPRSLIPASTRRETGARNNPEELVSARIAAARERGFTGTRASPDWVIPAHPTGAFSLRRVPAQHAAS